MKRVLAEYDIEVVEIERKTHSEAAISASKVRELLKSGNYDLLRELVPEVVYQFLEQHA